MVTILPSVHSLTNLSVTVSTNKTQYVTGETVAITGTVRDSQNNPLLAADVSIQVNDPGNNFVHVNFVFTGQAGGYSDQFIIPSGSGTGQYTIYITASKSGYNNAQSQAQFTVSSTATTSNTTSSSTSYTSSTGPSNKCLIATAAYGSELSPEVSTLRNFRDSEILRTSIGTAFMRVFNAFYYSFSPHVAAYISSNEQIRTITKTILYPLVGILYVSSRVFAATAFNGELAVTLAGVFASVTLGAVYLGPVMASVLCFFKKNRSSAFTKLVRSALAVTTASLIGLSLAETFQSAGLLTATAIATVLSCIVLGSMMVPWILMRHRKWD